MVIKISEKDYSKYKAMTREQLKHQILTYIRLLNGELDREARTPRDKDTLYDMIQVYFEEDLK